MEKKAGEKKKVGRRPSAWTCLCGTQGVGRGKPFKEHRRACTTVINEFKTRQALATINRKAQKKTINSPDMLELLGNDEGISLVAMFGGGGGHQAKPAQPADQAGDKAAAQSKAPHPPPKEKENSPRYSPTSPSYPPVSPTDEDWDVGLTAAPAPAPPPTPHPHPKEEEADAFKSIPASPAVLTFQTFNFVPAHEHLLTAAWPNFYDGGRRAHGSIQQVRAQVAKDKKRELIEINRETREAIEPLVQLIQSTTDSFSNLGTRLALPPFPPFLSLSFSLSVGKAINIRSPSALRASCWPPSMGRTARLTPKYGGRTSLAKSSISKT